MIDNDTVVQDINEELRLMFAIHKERFDLEDMQVRKRYRRSSRSNLEDMQVRKRYRRSSRANREAMIAHTIEHQRDTFNGYEYRIL